VPIYSGGATQSRVRQRVYLHRAARERLERTHRETERATRDAYLGVLSEISRVKALKQALESSRTAIQATEAGFEVGTRTTVDVLEEADILYVLMDATSLPGPGDLLVLDHVKGAVRKRPRPIILVLNKVDVVNKLKLLPVMETYARLFEWTDVVPVSAETGDNVDRLLSVTVAHLAEGDAAYDADTVTDQSMRTLAAEMIREKILHQTYEEVPYSVAVEIDEFVEEGKLARISATVLVERESHKAILIGKHGERLKAVGTEARRDMEQIFGMKVFLQLWVKVREAWREDAHALTELGY